MQNQTTQKRMANPTPAGLVALAVACVCFFAILSGRVQPSAMPLIGCWLLGGFVVQIIVGLLDVALPFIALTDLGILPAQFSHVAAWALLFSGIVALYLSATIVINKAYG